MAFDSSNIETRGRGKRGAQNQRPKKCNFMICPKYFCQDFSSVLKINLLDKEALLL